MVVLERDELRVAVECALVERNGEAEPLMHMETLVEFIGQAKALLPKENMPSAIKHVFDSRRGRASFASVARIPRDNRHVRRLGDDIAIVSNVFINSLGL